MQRVYTAANLPEAYLLLHMLEAAGIPAKVFNENAQGGVGELPFTHTYPEIWILDANDRHRALAILSGYDRPRDPPATVYCAQCGEENPESFDWCWQCKASL